LPADKNAAFLQPRGEGEVLFMLEVSVEPKMQYFQAAAGSLSITKALDDQAQALRRVDEGNVGGVAPGIAFMPLMPNQTGQRQQIPLRLKLGEKKAKELKELSGNLSAEVLAPPSALITVKDVLKSAGKTARGADGGELQVIEVSKTANGEHQLKIRLTYPPGNNPFMPFLRGPGGGAVQIQIGGVGLNPGVMPKQPDLPVLLDAKGKEFPLVSLPSQRMQGNVNGITRELTMVFRGEGEPDRLVLNGQSLATVPVAFTFKNVPLP
jgi:hypothetical protein